MSLLTSLSNKIEYMIAKSTSDPEAEDYAKQKADQAAADAKVKEEQDKLAKQTAEDADIKRKKDEEAAALADRSKFKPKELIGDIARNILSVIGILILVFFLLYGGHIAANKAIGYKVPFRILSFLYGIVFSFWVVPKSVYDVYWKKETLPYFTFLPISTYEPVGDIEKIFLGGFCYKEDEVSSAARAAVAALYSDAFTKSVNAAPAIAKAAVAAVATVAKPPVPPPAAKPVAPPPPPPVAKPPAPSPVAKPPSPPPSPVAKPPSPPSPSPPPSPVAKPPTPPPSPVAKPPSPPPSPVAKPPSPPPSPVAKPPAPVAVPPKGAVAKPLKHK